jgi:hypothetical protein
MAYAADGGPMIRVESGEAKLWIRLTVAGVTRPAVGVAPADAVELDKQLISDAIRNGAMRFGVALDLWSREDLGESSPGPSGPVPSGEVGAADPCSPLPGGAGVEASTTPAPPGSTPPRSATTGDPGGDAHETSTENLDLLDRLLSAADTSPKRARALKAAVAAARRAGRRAPSSLSDVTDPDLVRAALDALED